MRIWKTILTVLFISLLTTSYAQNLDRILDIFYKRYTDYPQLYKDWAFTVGDWDVLEKMLHDEMVKVLSQSYKILPIDTEEGNAIVNVCDRRNLPYGLEYQFFVIDMPGINAFVIPGGRVYLTSSFLTEISKQSNKEDVLAFVLGHEVAHACRRHWVSKIKQKYSTDFWGWMSSELLRRNNTDFLKEIVPFVMEVIYSGYSREFEKEADYYGFKYMTKAGYNITGGIDAFKILDRFSGGSGYDLMATHPPIQERIQLAENFKFQYQTDIRSKLTNELAALDDNTGLVSISLAYPTGSFRTVAINPAFQGLVIDFIPLEEPAQDQIKSVEFSTSKTGLNSVNLKAGKYLLFYQLRVSQRWFTPFDLAEESCGPLYITVRPKQVSFLQINPKGENYQLFDKNIPSEFSNSQILNEFMKRFYYQENKVAYHKIDFEPLPDSKPLISDIDIRLSNDIQEQSGKLVMSQYGSTIKCNFHTNQGVPNQTKLFITISNDNPKTSASLNITVNGDAVNSKFQVLNPNKMTYVFDITNHVSGGTNSISLKNLSTSVSIYDISIENGGVGLGRFYKLKID